LSADEKVDRWTFHVRKEGDEMVVVVVVAAMRRLRISTPTSCQAAQS
jgi:hypothetical protein